MEAIWILENRILETETTKEQSTAKFHVAVVGGPPGCGKTTTTFRLAFDLDKYKWQIFFSDAIELFANNAIEDIRTWFLSLRGKILFIIDNAHLTSERIFTFTESLENMIKEQRRILPCKLRVLYLETIAYLKLSPEIPSKQKYVAGTKIKPLPLTINEPLGFAGLNIEKRSPSRQVSGRIRTLIIEEGREIGETIFKRFLELESFFIALALTLFNYLLMKVLLRVTSRVN